MGDFQGHPFRGNQWGPTAGSSAGVQTSSGDYRAPHTGGNMPKDEAAFRRMSVLENPKESLYRAGERIEALPPDAELIVYHATDAATAERFLSEGIDTATKPTNLMRERWEAGEDAVFAPGRGIGAGLYVGGTAYGVEGYGRVILAIRTTRAAIEATPEAASLGHKPGHALASDDAMVQGRIDPANIKEVGERGFYPGGDAWDVFNRKVRH